MRIRQIELKGKDLLSGILHGGNQGPSFQLQQRRSDRICGTESSGGWIFPTAGAGKMQRCSVLVSKKGKVTVKVKEHQAKEPVQILAHSVKQYILKEGTPVPFLVDLGVMNKEGEIHRPAYDKFKQINRFLKLLRIFFRHCPREREVTILDFWMWQNHI